ncbi:hypothetical protein N7493_003618 [Penicillium malachiteum]|uniref:Uncharacterized protein n=1 Tax=Penicillium malachiteum TaxID=1324776 RepID=A0AAD6HQ01_9EURO|nr:hypothetical protein N7493_003618 [Penicillium malachiteum]
MENTEGTASSPQRENTSTSKEDDYNKTRKGKFRFKSSKSSRSKHSSDRTSKRSHSPSDSKERSYKKRPSHRSTRTHHQPNLNDNPTRSLSPDTAFRESLFDAMGDDEGAEYWQGVYGQPIHTYAVPQVEGPTGELEQMDEEEYAAYVRARMWERTRDGMLEEQERMRAERRRKKVREESTYVRDRERRDFDRAMEDSLRRGAERKARKRWEEAWETYLARWEEISKVVSDKDRDSSSKPLRNLLFWPVLSGKRQDVSPDSVRDFMRHAPASTDLLVILKTERVRWHPDKIQHRYSGLGIDDVVLRSVTEVFQIVDAMWNENNRRTG